jgi:hypothetical protein
MLKRGEADMPLQESDLIIHCANQIINRGYRILSGAFQMKGWGGFTPAAPLQGSA